MTKFIDAIGVVYGRLTILERVLSPTKANLTYYKCKCNCGNIAIISRPNLVSGHTISCGCYKKELMTSNKYKETHNESRTRLYHTWQSMKQRCYDINIKEYKWYGARGIGICIEWMDYISFSNWAKGNGYKKHLTIDRIDNDGDYEPNNCKWSTTKQQNRNKTTTRFVELNGEKKGLGEWSEILNIPMSTMVNRANRKCSPEQILNTNYKRRNIETITPKEKEELLRKWESKN